MSADCQSIEIFSSENARNMFELMKATRIQQQVKLASSFSFRYKSITQEMPLITEKLKGTLKENDSMKLTTHSTNEEIQDVFYSEKFSHCDMKSLLNFNGEGLGEIRSEIYEDFMALENDFRSEGLEPIEFAFY